MAGRSRSSSHGSRPGIVGAAALLAVLGPGARSALGQQFSEVTGALPPPIESTEGVTPADVDLDGDLDLFFADSAGFAGPGAKRQNRLLINRLETQAFQFVDESAARLGAHVSHALDVATGDIQDDGYVDAVFCNGFNVDPPSLYVNRGSASPGFFEFEGALRGLTTPLWSTACQFGDVDDDGDLDLVLNDAGPNFFAAPGGTPRLYVNDGFGFFTEDPDALASLPEIGPRDLEFLDVDLDWDLDLVCVNRDPAVGSRQCLLINDGNGAFSDLSWSLPILSSEVAAIAAGDLDGDLDPDLFTLGVSGPFGAGHAALRNETNAPASYNWSTGPPVAGAADEQALALMDVDTDGDLDALVGGVFGSDTVFRNDGGLTFTPLGGVIQPGADTTLDLAPVDLDNDGAYDLVTAQGWTGNTINRVYANTGSADDRAPVVTRCRDVSTAAVAGPWVALADVRDQVADEGRAWVGSRADYVVVESPAMTTVSLGPAGLDPAAITVTAGTTVIWTNDSGSPQSIASTTPPYEYESGLLTPGADWSYTFVSAGTYGYASSGSPSAFGTVTVTPAGGSGTVVGRWAGGSLHRFEMVDTVGGQGSELAYELRFTDWAGNETVTTSKVALLASCGFTTYGEALGGDNSLTLHASGNPAVGGTVELVTAGLPPGAGFALTALGFASASLPLGTGTILVDPTPPLITLAGLDQGGWSSVTFPVPGDPLLVGVEGFFQSVAFTSAVHLSNGVAFKVCSDCGCEGKYPHALELLNAEDLLEITIAKKKGTDADPVPPPPFSGGYFWPGWGAQAVGVVQSVQVKLNGTSNACCAKCKVGFIQTVESIDRVGYYEGGKTITVSLAEGCKLPLLDVSPKDWAKRPWYQHKGPVSDKACNQPFEVVVEDLPGSKMRLNVQGERLTRFIGKDKFRLWLVLDCPENKGSYSYQYFWEWETLHDYELEYDEEGNVTVKAGYKAEAKTTLAKAWKKGDPTPVLTAKSVGCVFLPNQFD